MIEDAVKRLYELGMGQNSVSLRDIAGALEMSSDKTEKITEKLLSKHWISKSNDDLQLTSTGEQKALQIIRAHRIWESYLANEGTAIEDLHEEADRSEHFATPQQIDAMEVELGYPKRDPHGDPIPSSNSEVVESGLPLTQWPQDQEARIVHVEDEPKLLHSQLIAMGLASGAKIKIIKQEHNRILINSQHLQHVLAPATAEKIFVIEAPPEAVPLGDLLTGEEGIVEEVDESGKSLRRLLDIGIVPGSKINVVRSAPLGDPIEFRIKDAFISLRRHEANKILVKKSRGESI